MENRLNASNQEIFDTLNESFSKREEDPKYPYNDDFLRMLLSTLLCNRFFLCQSVGLIKPNYFRSEIHQAACRILFQYFDKYKHPPTKIFMKELVEEFLHKRYTNQDETYRATRLVYLTELNVVYDYYAKGGAGNLMPLLDSTDAILDKITAFARNQALKVAFARSVELMRRSPDEDETYDKIDQLYKEARLVNRTFDIGLNYFEQIEDRYARLEANIEKMETFTTGFRSVDNALMGGGLTRGELGAVMAKSGGGKSLNLAWASVQNIIRGKKVLYLSTEMDTDRIATRFDAMISNVGQHELLLKKEEVWAALRDTVGDYEDKRRLIIKQFPSGTADMATVRAYHAQLVMLGFRPDLVIFDYPGDMKEQSGISSWDARFRLLREIRGFGVEEKHCTFIALHPNKSATELTLEEFMDESNQADAFKQDRIFDLFWTLNQIASEKKADVGRGFVAKARNGMSRFDFKIRYHFKDQTLKIKEITHQEYMSYLTRSQDADEDATQTKIDKVTIDKPRRFEPSDGERVN